MRDWGRANTSTTNSNKTMININNATRNKHGIFSDEDLLTDVKFFDIRKLAWIALYEQGKFLSERPDSKTEKIDRYMDNVIWRAQDATHPVIWVKRQDLINEILNICRKENVDMRSRNIEISI